MCPANHINSRSLLRSSSTREPSDPPHRVVFLVFIRFVVAIRDSSSSSVKKHKKYENAISNLVLFVCLYAAGVVQVELSNLYTTQLAAQKRARLSCLRARSA
jgi:hypothetical protein